MSRPPTHEQLHRQRYGGAPPRRTAADHAREREARKADPRQVRADRIRNSAQWQRLRDWKRRHFPFCEECERHGATTPAAQVHHVKPVHSHPHLAFRAENLMSVCTSCHARLEAAERAGG